MAKRKRAGPKPETLHVEGVEWKDAVRHALNVKKPEGGWPKPSLKKKTQRKPKG